MIATLCCHQLVLLLSLAVVEGRVYDRCSLARSLVNTHRVGRGEVADWVCLVQHESVNMDTAGLARRHGTGHTGHGRTDLAIDGDGGGGAHTCAWTRPCSQRSNRRRQLTAPA